MDMQTLFDIALAGFGALGGWILNNLKSSIDDLHKRDMEIHDKMVEQDGEIIEKLQRVELLVAGTYVKRDDMEKIIDKLTTAIFAKLDRIEAMLNTKADK